jgi:hypothetical protein
VRESPAPMVPCALQLDEEDVIAGVIGVSEQMFGAK